MSRKRGLTTRMSAVVAAAALSVTGLAVAGLTGGSAEAATTGVGMGQGYLSTNGNKIVDATGKTVRITGINWFGMETDNKTFHGLWSSTPWRAQLDHMAELGYNTLRVPFSNDALKSGAIATGINDYINPDLIGLSPLQILDKVIEYAGSKGMRVILDRHRPTSAGQSALWYTAATSEATWINDWKMLAARYAGNTTVIGADLHNEPHADGTNPNATGACWGCGDTARDWRLAAERAGNAILSVEPNWLIFVEGVSCPSGGNSNVWDNDPSNDERCGWWGGNLSQVRDFPVRLNKPNKLVYSPHEYATSVYLQTWFEDPSYPANMPAIWDYFFGYIYKENIAPIMMGEFGSTLRDPRDKVWLTNLMAYLGTGTGGMSFTYWSWNPNSGDTGGIVGDDWATVNTEKQNILSPYLYSPVPPGGTTSSTTSTTSSTTSTSTTTSSSSTTTSTSTSTTTSTSTSTSTSTTTSSSSSSSTSSTTSSSSSPTGGGTCTAVVKIESSWPDGYQATITVRNDGTSAVNPWTMTFTLPSGVTIANGWNSTITQSGTKVTAAAPAWAPSLAPNASASIGFIAAGSSSPPPSGVTLNGAAC